MPNSEDLDEFLIVGTEQYKLVYDYTGIDFNNQMEVDCVTWMCLVRDAFIHKMKQTEDGRKYLEDAYYLKKTSPDVGELRKQFGGE